MGAVVVTISPGVRVRSQPRVADDSIKLEPLLPTGTELKVVGGPVTASGYAWYEVVPVDFALSGGARQGWVASADKDGTPWIAAPGRQVADAELAVSAAPRAAANPGDAKKAAASINAFGVDLYRRILADPELRLAGKGIVFSPTSLALALAMARAGAIGQTAVEMDKVLHTSGWDALGSGLNSLDQALASRNRTWTEPEWQSNASGESQQVQVEHDLALRIANGAFAQHGWAIEQAYLDRIGSAFGAGLRLLDFISHPEAARQAINAWVSQKTEERIPELLQSGDIQDITRLVLVNAVYLKANWAKEFLPQATKPAPFTRMDGSAVQAPTMYVIGGQAIPYARGTDWQAVDLAYRSAPGQGDPRAANPLAMTVILPIDLASFEKTLTSAQLGRIVSTLESERVRLTKDVTQTTMDGPCGCGCYPYSVDLFMPRFRIDTRANLKPVLEALGMPLAFDPVRADFSAIHDRSTGGIYISRVIHQANIDVDEKGTEAAAATAIGMDVGGCTGPTPSRTITLRLDRPFLFVLRDVETGAVLFMGRVVDPSTKG